MTSQRIRLDQYLANAGHSPSRSRARDMIARGCVTVDGVVTLKHSQLVADTQNIQIDDPVQEFVSRAALKLTGALDATGFDVRDKTALDLGASTGGFTQVLLNAGAKRVIAVDVGHGQLHDRLRKDARVEVHEHINARHITDAFFTSERPEIIVSDLSFVSLTIAAEPSLLCAAKQAWAILLVKPQFEVGREGIGKGGLVTDEELIHQTNNKLRQWFSDLPGWEETHFLPSPIKGGDGNREFLLCGVRT